MVRSLESSWIHRGSFSSPLHHDTESPFWVCKWASPRVQGTSAWHTEGSVSSGSGYNTLSLRESVEGGGAAHISPLSRSYDFGVWRLLVS